MAISKGDFPQLVKRWAEGYYTFAKSCHHYHVSGFADVYGTLFGTPSEEVQKLMGEFEAQISDEELRKAFLLLRERVQEMVTLDRKMVDWLASFVGLPAPQDRRDRKCLRRRLNKIIEGDAQGPVGPVWVTSPEYQALVSKSAEILHATAALYQEIDRRIQSIE
jgi:hypothetical protein